MTASPSNSPGAVASDAPFDPARIDASCRVPLFVLFVSAAVWAVLASALALIASIKFHSPDFLADCAWLTYGRVHAAAGNAQLYGFSLQAGLGVALWIIARLGGNRVSQPWLVAVGGKIWNLGVLVGVVAILAGDSTGFENLEMPRYAALFLFLAYLMIGFWMVLTLHDRVEDRLSPPQWFLLAALFWFPWIYSTANLLLLVFPVRGVMQSVIAWWFSNNLNFVWLALVGLAAIFHFIPKFVGRALHSRHLALFTFWTLILFASWCGIPNSAPVPAWMPVVSSIATVLTLVTLLSVGLNLYHTKRGSRLEGKSNCAPYFIYFGLGMFQLAGAMRIIGVLPAVSPITTFTWFISAQAQLNSYGFFAMTMFGAIYYIVPKVSGLEWPWAGAVRWHFRCSATGILLSVLPLAIGGIVQGIKLNDAQIPFMELTKATLPFLRVSTVGDTLILLGHLLLVANLTGLVVRYCLTHFLPVFVSVTSEPEPAEVNS
jgi:cytochrome c oxidase cbb3-type subunit 1